MWQQWSMFEMFIVEHMFTILKKIYKKYTVYYAVSNKLVCHSKHSHIEKEREQGWVSMFNVRGRGDVKTTQVCSWFREAGLEKSAAPTVKCGEHCASRINILSFNPSTIWTLSFSFSISHFCKSSKGTCVQSIAW